MNRAQERRGETYSAPFVLKGVDNNSIKCYYIAKFVPDIKFKLKERRRERCILTKILVVEEESVTRNFLAELFREHGHEVEDVSTVGEGLDVLNGYNVDLLFSDGAIRPEGQDAWQKLATKAQEKDIPFVVFSGGMVNDLTDPMAQAVRREGGVPLAKPATGPSVLRAVATALG